MRPNKKNFSRLLMEYDLAAEILDFYDLSLLRLEVDSGRHKVWTSGGIKLLYKTAYNEEQIMQIRQAYQHLRDNGFSPIAEWNLSKYGKPFVTVNGKNYYLLDAVQGMEFLPWDPGHLSEAARTMAAYHRASSNWRLMDPPFSSSNSEGWLQELKRKKQDIERHMILWEQNARKHDYKRRILFEKKRIFNQADHAIEELERSPLAAVEDMEKKRHGFIHTDFEEPNLVATDRGEIWLQNLGQCRQGMRLEDLGRFIFQYADWDLEKTFYILRNYHEVYPLSREEMEILPAYLRFPHDCWELFNKCREDKEPDKDLIKETLNNLIIRQEYITALNCLNWNFLQNRISHTFRNRDAARRTSPVDSFTQKTTQAETESRYFDFSPSAPPVLIPWGNEFYPNQSGQNQSGVVSVKNKPEYPGSSALSEPGPVSAAPEKGKGLDPQEILERIAMLEEKLQRALEQAQGNAGVRQANEMEPSPPSSGEALDVSTSESRKDTLLPEEEPLFIVSTEPPPVKVEEEIIAGSPAVREAEVHDETEKPDGNQSSTPDPPAAEKIIQNATLVWKAFPRPLSSKH